MTETTLYAKAKKQQQMDAEEVRERVMQALEKVCGHRKKEVGLHDKILDLLGNDPRTRIETPKLAYKTLRHFLKQEQALTDELVKLVRAAPEHGYQYGTVDKLIQDILRSRKKRGLMLC